MQTILITGGNGMVGRNLKNIIDNYKYKVLSFSSKEYDLTIYDSCFKLFSSANPTFVIHLAAEVGGLYKNMNKKVNMFEKNILLNVNVLKCCHLFGVKKLISCLSTCIFPDKVEYPIVESSLHDGKPHASNYCYAYAKRMLDIQTQAYKEEHNSNFMCVIPCNIYGKYDNFSIEDGHVIPSLIHKCYLSKKNNTPFIVRGTGEPLRQFIYAEDFAYIIVNLLENYEDNENIIISTGEEDEISIGDVARIISDIFEQPNIIFDDSYSNGQYKKTVSNEKFKNFMSEFKFTDIRKGLEESIQWFVKNYDKCRK